MTKNKYERRYCGDALLRAFIGEDDNGRYAEGYAHKFGVESQVITERGTTFIEVIKRGAFDNVLASPNLNVKYVYNHDMSKMIARSKSGTLAISADETGLFFRASFPENVSYANDLYELIQRGDISGNSFAFRLKEEDYTLTRGEDGMFKRTIHNVSGLVDVSSVQDPIYPETTLDLRAIIEADDAKVEEEIKKLEDEAKRAEEEMKKEMDKMKMKIRIFKL